MICKFKEKTKGQYEEKNRYSTNYLKLNRCFPTRCHEQTDSATQFHSKEFFVYIQSRKQICSREKQSVRKCYQQTSIKLILNLSVMRIIALVSVYSLQTASSRCKEILKLVLKVSLASLRLSHKLLLLSCSLNTRTFTAVGV